MEASWGNNGNLMLLVGYTETFTCGDMMWMLDWLDVDILEETLCC